MKTLFTILIFIHCVYSAKILGVFPTPSISHQVVFRALMKDLAARGHELLILTPDPFETGNPNVTQIDLHFSYKTFHEAMNFVDVKNSNTDENDLMKYFFVAAMKYFEEQLSHPGVKKLIAEREKYRFDVIIIEGLINYPMLSFGEIFDAPIIEITSLENIVGSHEWMGNEANPVLHPEIVFPFQQRRLAFDERWKCLKFLVFQKFATLSQLNAMNNLINKHFPIKNPDLKMLKSRIALMMTNTHPALGFIRPILPNTIQLGFMHIEPPKPLEDGLLKKFLDQSKHGVIYMSFGSNAKSKDLGPEVQRMFLNAFESLKYDIIWKFEGDELPDKPKNVMLEKWLPQADLLAHPNVKLFITHGGQQSMEETIDRTVPTIVIPIIADQISNAERMEKMEIGKRLELHTLTKEQLKAAVQEMLHPKYRKNIQKLRNLIYDEPMTTRQKAVWWTDAKILGIFPTPSISHQVVFRALMKDLAARGHELIILTPDPFKTDNPNITQIDLHSSYKVVQETINFVDFKHSNKDETDFSNQYFQTVMKYLEEQLSHPEVIKLIAEREKYNFDVIILEGLLNYPMLAFGEIFDAPIIEFTSLDSLDQNHKWMGNEANPIVHPEIIFPFQERRLTFYERWKCLKFSVNKKLRMFMQLDVIYKFIKKHFQIENPDINKMRSRIALLMTNTHPAMGYIRPILPNTIQLGFMHIEQPRPLDDGPLKTFLDQSKHGVIYMSFGSNVRSQDLGTDIKTMFLNTFKSLKYDFIWKFESNDLKDIPKNLMIQKWLPQTDLLAHPKIKLFITHGGQQSMDETIDRTVPAIVIPFFGDQAGNAKRMEVRKIGMHLELQTLSEEKLWSAIQEMLKPEYKENVQKLRDLIYDEPMTARQKAVWWTEYVIRHNGTKHFHYHGKQIPFYEKHFLDFAAIGLTLVIALVKICLFTISKILLICSKKIKSE